mmetsp:Transcript_39148/g.123600  ORF Transcript_39148/g.123600 Transcript_39148/m.123600 type:complete len:462 (+) Transcript_39148:188-1573(+)
MVCRRSGARHLRRGKPNNPPGENAGVPTLFAALAVGAIASSTSGAGEESASRPLSAAACARRAVSAALVPSVPAFGVACPPSRIEVQPIEAGRSGVPAPAACAGPPLSSTASAPATRDASCSRRRASTSRRLTSALLSSASLPASAASASSFRLRSSASLTRSSRTANLLASASWRACASRAATCRISCSLAIIWACRCTASSRCLAAASRTETSRSRASRALPRSEVAAAAAAAALSFSPSDVSRAVTAACAVRIDSIIPESVASCCSEARLAFCSMLARRSLTGWIDSDRRRPTMPSSAATSSGDGACGARTRPGAAPSPFGPLGGAAEAGATEGVAARLAADDLSQSGVRTPCAGARTPDVACGPLLAEAAEVAAADVPAVGDAMAAGVVGSAKLSLEGGCDAAAAPKSPFAPAAGAPKAGGGSLAAGGSGGGGEGRGELAPGLCCALVRGDFAMGCS